MRSAGEGCDSVGESGGDSGWNGGCCCDFGGGGCDSDSGGGGD